MQKEPRDSKHSLALSRRQFLGLGAAGGALALAGPMACTPGSDSGTGGGSRAGYKVADSELDELGIADLQSGVEEGKWSSRSITEMYMKRIEDLNHNGPELRAVIETNPDAIAIAEELDAERAAGNTRGPMHGIPILLKDNVGTADKMTTTAGSLALEGSIPARDSFVAQRLREAGAILLGKANLSEWANFRSTRSSSGWSARGGQCRNPYVLDRNPCGSSSGSGCAVSANLTAVAIGTETDGSIVCPASANGVVGIKPTVGLVGRTRIVPISHTQDTAGPMARSVRDAAIVLGALVGVDPEDVATNASEGNSHSDYTQFLDPDGLRGARIGVARNSFGFHSGVDGLMEEAIEAIRAQGAEVIDPAEIKTASDIGEPEFEILLYEFKADLNAYLEGLGPQAPLKSLEEIIAFNEANKDREMPWFGQELLERSQEKGPLTDKTYTDALNKAKRLSQKEGIDAVMAEHNLDAFLAPTGGPAWTTDLVNGDHFSGGSSSAAAVSGYPNITLPSGYIHGLPVGISFFGRAWSEPTLLRIAYAYEQATNHRRSPQFVPSAHWTESVT